MGFGSLFIAVSIQSLADLQHHGLNATDTLTVPKFISLGLTFPLSLDSPIQLIIGQFLLGIQHESQTYRVQNQIPDFIPFQPQQSTSQ